jgi:hypothetical protein
VGAGCDPGPGEGVEFYNSQALLENLQRHEGLLCESLQQPTPEDKVRYGVTPLFAAILYSAETPFLAAAAAED